MALASLLRPLPQWLSGPAPEQDSVLLTQLTLVRNLADFSFVERCGADERQGIEERVLSALESLNLLATGEYFRLREIDSMTARVLAERRLLSVELLNAKGPSGLYVSQDQGASIMVNGAAHLCLRVVMPGLQLQEAWMRLSALDDALASVLDYAWNETLGFLTGDIRLLGTGLKAGLLMHLPGTAWANQMALAKQSAANNRLLLEGLRPGPLSEMRAARRTQNEGVSVEQVRDQALFTNVDGAITGQTSAAVGDLYHLVNQGTLGESEDEILFHLRHTAQALLTRESDAREELRTGAALATEDRVGRAHGVACGARLLGFGESLALLSSLRYGASAGLLKLPVQDMTDILLRAQAGHLQMARGQALDALNLTIERAELFRGRFSGATLER